LVRKKWRKARLMMKRSCSSPLRTVVLAIVLLVVVLLVPAVVPCQLGQSSAATDNVLTTFTSADQRFSVNRACSLMGVAIEINWNTGPVHLDSSSYNYFRVRCVSCDARERESTRPTSPH
jgi:hypothetical protein